MTIIFILHQSVSFLKLPITDKLYTNPSISCSIPNPCFRATVTTTCRRRFNIASKSKGRPFRPRTASPTTSGVSDSMTAGRRTICDSRSRDFRLWFSRLPSFNVPTSATLYFEMTTAPTKTKTGTGVNKFNLS